MEFQNSLEDVWWQLHASVSFCLSCKWQNTNSMVERCEQRKCFAIFRNVVQIVFLNFVFMVIRLVIFFVYKKEESIFIAKNGIAIYMSALEIYSIARTIDLN